MNHQTRHRATGYTITLWVEIACLVLGFFVLGASLRADSPQLFLSAMLFGIGWYAFGNYRRSM